MQEMTFTEKEIAGVAEFVNFVYGKAKWDITTKETQQLSKYLAHMANHIKKMDDYKFEFVKATEISKENKFKDAAKAKK